MDSGLRDSLAALLAGCGPVSCAAGSMQALEQLELCRTIRLLVLFEVSDDFTTLDLLEEARRRRPDVGVLVLSRAPTVQHATEAIRRGAVDFVPVPYSEEVLRKEVVRILEAAELRDHVDQLRQLVTENYGFDHIVSESPRMRSAFDRALAASRSDTPVLILGETGTGKELFARAIHASGRRGTRAYVPVNCAALPADLIESELFGHRRGAFSGAHHDHPGLFVAAHGGTLFLDEISELPSDAQAKLLRVVQDGEVRHVGGLDSRRVDVRIIAASNRTQASMRDGGLRQDLFYRLSVLIIDIPPLRERLDDVPLLVAYFLAGLRERGVCQLARLDKDALDLLLQYSFPGNVRELQNMVESMGATLSSTSTSIRVEDVRDWLRRRGSHALAATSASTFDVPLKLNELETWAIAEALRRAAGNKRLAARLLGISPDTLYRKLPKDA